jgi:hypothetical protein
MLHFPMVRPAGHLTSLGGALIALILLAALSACSSGPSLGEAMRAQGVELAAIGDQWTEGDGLVEEGQEQVEDGEAMIKKGRKLVEKGEANIERGEKMRRTAEASYRDKTGKDPPTN